MLQKIKNLFFHLPKSIICNLAQAFPSKKLKLIGVTGTDGKTTTSVLLYETLKSAGIKAGIISTIGAEFGDNQKIETGLHMTSPDPLLTQKIFKKMLKAGVTHVVCEVTAHALDQYRFFGSKFETSVITNTSHEHLDYFSNINKYIQTKGKIFKFSKTAILNKDDPSYSILKKDIRTPITTFSINKTSNFQAKKIKISPQSLNFEVNKLLLTTDSSYRYQVYNILSVLAIIDQLKIDPKFLVKTIKNFPQTKGRREELPNSFKFKTIIDFAHTPAALESTLSSLKKTTKGNLIVLFGATGGRDQSKRPMMGKVVSQLVNIAIITSDDTRNEDIQNISKQIISGIPEKNSQLVSISNLTSKKEIKKIINLASKNFVYLTIPNRQDAFNLAIKLANDKDTVIACGKGHESTILHGKTEYPWSETEAFRTALNEKNKNE